MSRPRCPARPNPRPRLRCPNPPTAAVNRANIGKTIYPDATHETLAIPFALLAARPGAAVLANLANRSIDGGNGGFFPIIAYFLLIFFVL